MILAAGFGTRLRPLTRSMPKPMVPLCNRPLIGWALESLISEGIDDIVVNLHHAPRSIEEWLPIAAGDRARIHFSHEHEILGTGGGIRHARALLEGTGHFALVNGDTVQHPPLRKLARCRQRSDALAALLLREPPPDESFTSVYLDGEDVTGFGSGRGRALMFAGAHVISDRIFDLLPARPFSGIVEHAYIPVLESQDQLLAGLEDDGWWFDIGTPRRLLTATRAMLALMMEGEVASPEGSGIAGDSLMSSSSSGSARGSVIGADCLIAEGAAVEGSLLLDGVSVGADAQVHDSIIGPGVAIPDGFVCENVLLCARRGDEEEGEPVAGGGLIAVSVDPSRPRRAS